MDDERILSERAEMYLKTIYELAGPKGLVPVIVLADRLGISPISATEMIHRMEEQGLVIYTPYKGVSLTEAGLQSAIATMRGHRLWECFLADILGLPWEEVHDLACGLEHAAGSEVIDALGIYLGWPSTCPHGNPIPGSTEDLSVLDDIQLDQLQVGESGVVQRIRPESTSILRYLAAHGIKPGSRVSTIEIEPLDGPRAIRIGRNKVLLGRRIAAHVMVETSSVRISDDQQKELRLSAKDRDFCLGM
jgi:DtxR family Mn-dependent transcriptional regulator